MSKFNPQKNTTEFIQHLEMGVEEMGWNFMDFFPTPVTMSNGEDGYVFSQIENPKDNDATVCVLHDGITFPNSTVTLMFKEDQRPSMVAVLFLTSMLQKGETFLPNFLSKSLLLYFFCFLIHRIIQKRLHKYFLEPQQVQHL